MGGYIRCIPTATFRFDRKLSLNRTISLNEHAGTRNVSLPVYGIWYSIIVRSSFNIRTLNGARIVAILYSSYKIYITVSVNRFSRRANSALHCEVYRKNYGGYYFLMFIFFIDGPRRYFTINYEPYYVITAKKHRVHAIRRRGMTRRRYNTSLEKYRNGYYYILSGHKKYIL